MPLNTKPPRISSSTVHSNPDSFRSTAFASDRDSTPALSSGASAMSAVQPGDSEYTSGSAESCPYDPDAWFAEFQDQDDCDFLEVSDDIPTNDELEKASNIPVFDADGISRPFRSLYQGSEHMGQRQLIIFVRHFYCIACQSYLKGLADMITPSAYFSLPTPTTITVIGCGAPNLIPKYTTKTTCPFRVYSDPTRKLYKALGMKNKMNFGKRPEYMQDITLGKLMKESFTQMVRTGHSFFAGGPVFQVGGEFLFEDGEPVWCHRMRAIRGHAEMSVLRKVLDMDEEVAVVEEAKTVVMSPVTPISPVSPISPTTPVTPTSTQRGLRLVWDGKGERARLSRESRVIE